MREEREQVEGRERDRLREERGQVERREREGERGKGERGGDLYALSIHFISCPFLLHTLKHSSL